MTAARVVSPAQGLRIVVLGYIVRYPLGGMAWSHMQYLMGLRDLGHEIYFVEYGDDYASCYDPERNDMVTDPAYGLRFAADALGGIGFGDRWAYHDAHSSRWSGPRAEDIHDIGATADVVLNVGGANPLCPPFSETPVRVLIDQDPVFTQARYLKDPASRRFAEAHTDLFTFGENVGTGRSAIPDDGLPWRPTRHPIQLSAWPAVPVPAGARFTTVMNWESYPAREHDGVRYGMKSDSFARYLDLPGEVGPVLELALGGPTAPHEMLRQKGWSIADPREATRDPSAYQRYIQGSRAEFTVAKQGYVAARSGWFSERSAAYLASGRPVVTQETGFSHLLPVGEGLLAYTTPEEAAEAIRKVQGDHTLHSKRAREIAHEHFASGPVLQHLMNRVS